MTKMTLQELSQRMVDMEVGLAMRLDDFAAQLARFESHLATVKEHLEAKMPAADRSPEAPTAFRHRIDPRFVARRLNLRKLESRVAALLAEGRSVDQIAAVMGRRETTVRWFLKQIYGRLEISTQAQLVRLLLPPTTERGGETRAARKKSPGGGSPPGR